MSTRSERAARKNQRRCLNCGEFGPHYVPPGFGTAGMYICERNEENVRKYGLTPARQPGEKRLITRKMYLTLTVMQTEGCGPFLAAEAVASTAIEHPEWNMDEEKTWTEWEKEYA